MLLIAGIEVAGMILLFYSVLSVPFVPGYKQKAVYSWDYSQPWTVLCI